MLAAFDAKEFRRGGERKPARLGESRTSGGFFTQIAAGVIISDEKALRDAFTSAFRDMKQDEGIEFTGTFCSYYRLRRHCGEDVDRTRRIAEKILEDVSDSIEAIRLNYVYLSEDRSPVIYCGGRKGKREQMSTHHFLRRIGNFMPVLAAWWYTQDRNVEAVEEIRLDHVELPVIGAWSELIETRRPVIVPSGDECDPAVCVADLVAAITDARLSERRLFLRPDHLADVWRGSPFDVQPFFFQEKFLHAMTWKDSAAVHTGAYWKRPMTFLMVASTLVVDEVDLAAMGEEDLSRTVRLRDFIEERGWMNDVYAYAQCKKGAAKAYNPGDRSQVADGDTVVCVGEQSLRRARDLATAVDIEVLPLKELRKMVK